jgi:hypothetical protein
MSTHHHSAVHGRAACALFLFMTRYQPPVQLSPLYNCQAQRHGDQKRRQDQTQVNHHIGVRSLDLVLTYTLAPWRGSVGESLRSRTIHRASIRSFSSVRAPGWLNNLRWLTFRCRGDRHRQNKFFIFTLQRFSWSQPR